MKTLAEFLTNFINQRIGGTCLIHASMIKSAIKAYKKHLQEDSPKTVHWAMIEKDLITALERMQCQDSLEGARHNNQNEKESDLGEVKHPICPINIYFEGDENKIDLTKCDFENRSCTNACNENSVRRL